MECMEDLDVDGSEKILIEVMYKADYCLPCLYMDEAVREIMPKYDKFVEYRRVEFMKGEGKKRFFPSPFKKSTRLYSTCFEYFGRTSRTASSM